MARIQLKWCAIVIFALLNSTAAMRAFADAPQFSVLHTFDVADAVTGASQTGSQGINWWTMAALSTAAIMPLLLVGVLLERYIVMGLTAGAGK